MSARLARLVVRRPGLVLLAALALSAALVPVVLRLRLDTDVMRLMPSGRADVDAFARFARSFVAEQVLIAVIESDDPAKLAPFADDLGAELRKDPLVAEAHWRLQGEAATFVRDHLLALITVDELDAAAARLRPDAMPAAARRIRSLISAPGGSALAPLIQTDPLDLLPSLARRLGGGLPIDTRSGYFLSADGKALLVYVRPRAASSDAEADRALVTRVSELARAHGATIASDGIYSHRGLEIGFTGACAYTLTYRDWLHRDALWSTPASLGVVLFLFAFFFRSLRVLPLVGAPLLLGLLWSGAAAVVIFGHVNVVSLSFSAVLVSIGIDFPIQIYNRLRDEMATAPPLDALEKTIAALAGPSLVATLGPALVFFACGLSRYGGLRELGVLAGVGLCLNLVAMLTVLPALLATAPRLWARQTPARWGEASLAALGRLALARPRSILVAAAVVAVAAVPLALRLRVGEKLVTVHPPSMPPVRVEAELSAHFGEREQMLVALVEDSDPERALERNDAWTAEGARLKDAGILRGVQSLSSLFPSLATQAARRARIDAAGGAATAGALEAALTDVGADPAAFAPFVAQLRQPHPVTLDDGRRSDLAFLLGTHLHDGNDGRRLATFFFAAPGKRDEAERALVAFSRGPAGGVVTGSTLLDRALRDAVVHDTTMITLASVLGVALLLAVAYRRWRSFVAVFLPLALAWLLFAAALGALGLPLTLFNLLAVPLVIGYGIDDHVFLLHRFQNEQDLAATLRSTGRAIVLTSLSTIAGFAGLAIARFDGLRAFGLSGALAVLFCLLAALAVLPALLALLRPRA